MTSAHVAGVETLSDTGVAGEAAPAEMRADAARNRHRLLMAARQAFEAYGPAVPLDVIARRAGVGIGTLYRHFPERRRLVGAVAAEALMRTTAALRGAVAEEPDAFSALRRYLHAALDSGVGAVMPLLDDEVGEDEEVMRLRDENAKLQATLLERAKREKSLRPGVEFGDIGLAVARFSRPIGFGFAPDLDAEVGHRHLDVFIDGLHAGCSPRRLCGPALTLARLRAMKGRPDA